MITFTHGKREAESKPTAVAGGRIKASPLAKSLAAEHGVALSSITGSGPNGRIVAEDIMNAKKALAAKPAAKAAAPTSSPAAAGAPSPAVAGAVPYIATFAVPPRTPEEGPV